MKKIEVFYIYISFMEIVIHSGTEGNSSLFKGTVKEKYKGVYCID